MFLVRAFFFDSCCAIAFYVLCNSPMRGEHVVGTRGFRVDREAQWKVIRVLFKPRCLSFHLHISTGDSTLPS